MARWRWTLYVVCYDGTRVSRVFVPRQVAQIFAGALLILLSLVASVAIGLVKQTPQTALAGSNGPGTAPVAAEPESTRLLYDGLQSALDEHSSVQPDIRTLAEPLVQPFGAGRGFMAAGLAGPVMLRSTRPAPRLDAPRAPAAFAAAYDLNDMLRRARWLAASWRDATSSLPEDPEVLRSTPSISPTHGNVSSNFSFSRLHPLLGLRRAHQGIDISAPRGTAIVATANGTVSYVGWQGQYGLMVEIEHGHGYSTRYAHASRTAVRVGQSITRGDIIGQVGSTGLSVGPHLHYEVLVNGRPVNPLDYILAGEVLQD
jgi:murein DD-endopeptidase MepM/ murein hydrolase activator NlpD